MVIGALNWTEGGAIKGTWMHKSTFPLPTIGCHLLVLHLTQSKASKTKIINDTIVGAPLPFAAKAPENSRNIDLYTF